jgi:hypothetical protein
MTTRRRSARSDAARPDLETYLIGTWAGRPNYGCPFCASFRTLDGAAEVVTHIALLHRSQAIAPAPEAPVVAQES